MARYQVKLYKDLLSPDGHLFRCLQSVTEVDANAPSTAVAQVLGKLHQTARDWRISVNPIDGRERPGDVSVSPERGSTQMRFDR